METTSKRKARHYYVNKYHYYGLLIKETESHFIIKDKKIGIVWLPKVATVIREVSEGDNISNINNINNINNK